ncbi:MAG: bifunctional helix-turn-helix transcriptional regulator/GNAT family N-acetyltransferase [Actinomycetota bacterium]
MTTASIDDLIDTLRRFNRSHTQRIGVLDESFLETGRPLSQSRLLYEIGAPERRRSEGSTAEAVQPGGGDGVEVAALRRALGLDSGYLSRLLRQLEADDLIVVAPAADAEDGRTRSVRLTPAGHLAWQDLEQRSEALALDLVGPLGARHRHALTEALTVADRLLRAATVALDIVDPRSEAALTSMGRYFAELDQRFTDGFDPGDTLVADAPALAAPDGAFVVAHSDGRPVACGGVQRIDDTTAEIKRMWVDGDWRGVGLGARMLRTLEDTAADLGYRRVVLDTNATLDEAIAMYQRTGYTSIERYNDNPYAQRWFARSLPGTPPAEPGVGRGA